MKLKQTTIDYHRIIVEHLINNGNYQDALLLAAKHPRKSRLGYENSLLISKTTLLREYEISWDELNVLNHIVKDNPFYKHNGGKMTLFLASEVDQKFKKKSKYK